MSTPDLGEYTIAVDVMGGDLGPSPLVRACAEFLTLCANIKLILVGDANSINKELAEASYCAKNLSVVHADEMVLMQDKPSYALRNRRQSSMWKALKCLSDGLADACVSAGNTGALMAMSRVLINTLPGIERPAICTRIPTERAQTYVLDLGANIDCTANQLYQFALMGSALYGALSPAKDPAVALLNVGVESSKGSDRLKLASELITGNKNLNYLGYVEADRLFSGDIPVVVCDGFSGNIALKASEGLARFISRQMEVSFLQSRWNKLIGVLTKPIITQLKDKLNPGHYNGASLLGLQKIVVKSHGNAYKHSFSQALFTAKKELEQKLPERINQALSNTWKS